MAGMLEKRKKPQFKPVVSLSVRKQLCYLRCGRTWGNVGSCFWGWEQRSRLFFFLILKKALLWETKTCYQSLEQMPRSPFQGHYSFFSHSRLRGARYNEALQGIFSITVLQFVSVSVSLSPFWDRMSLLCTPGWSRMFHIDHTGFELTEVCLPLPFKCLA